MKFNFKIYQYQTDAVESTVDIFAGQPSRDGFQYRRDLGKGATGLFVTEADFAGYRNADIELTDQQLLANVRGMQRIWSIPESKNLSHDLGRLGLDIEMETGTGKTYVECFQGQIFARKALQTEASAPSGYGTKKAVR